MITFHFWQALAATLWMKSHGCLETDLKTGNFPIFPFLRPEDRAFIAALGWCLVILSCFVSWRTLFNESVYFLNELILYLYIHFQVCVESKWHSWPILIWPVDRDDVKSLLSGDKNKCWWSKVISKTGAGVEPELCPHSPFNGKSVIVIWARYYMVRKTDLALNDPICPSSIAVTQKHACRKLHRSGRNQNPQA